MMDAMQDLNFPVGCVNLALPESSGMDKEKSIEEREYIHGSLTEKALSGKSAVLRGDKPRWMEDGFLSGAPNRDGG